MNLRSPREYHVMTAELIEDRQTMRYSCAVCQRCVEDSPEGIRVLHRGDTSARHEGGRIAALEHEVKQQPSEALAIPPRHLMH